MTRSDIRTQGGRIKPLQGRTRKSKQAEKISGSTRRGAPPKKPVEHNGALAPAIWANSTVSQRRLPEWFGRDCSGNREVRIVVWDACQHGNCTWRKHRHERHSYLLGLRPNDGAGLQIHFKHTAKTVTSGYWWSTGSRESGSGLLSI